MASFPQSSIDQAKSSLLFDRCPKKCGYVPWYISPEQDEVLDNGDWLFMFDWEGYESNQGPIHLWKTDATEYVEAYPEIFNKKGFDSLPERQPWDHAIKLTPGSKPTDCKIYPLNPSEQKSLDEFLEENLQSG